MWLMTGCDWSWKINIRCYLCCEYPATNKSEERFRISSNISEIIENSSESPDLVLSSTLNTYTTDLINFQSAQIEIPSEKRRKDGVNDIIQCSNPPLELSFTQNKRERGTGSCLDDFPRQPKDRCKDYLNLLTLYWVLSISWRQSKF